MRTSLSVTALALALGCSASHAAVSLSPGGLGQGLLFPYFTTEDGQSAVIAVHNSTDNGKALKIRVLESYAGRETLTFNVYLPPRGGWAAALVADTIGGARLMVPSGACSAPEVPLAGVPLRPFAYSGDFDDAGSSSPVRTREGLVEIIDLGTLSATLATAAANADGGGCPLFTQRWVSGPWSGGDTGDGIGAPRGGLRGEAMLLDVGRGTAFGYRALAFTGLSSAPRHTTPALPDPRLTDILVPLGEDIEVNLIDDAGEPVTLRYQVARSADAISALLASRAAFGAYSVDDTLDARTDWIVSFPTRRAYVDDAPGGLLPIGTNPRAPFASRTCEATTMARYDLRGTRLSGSAGDPLSLCGAAQVIRFRDGDTAGRLVGGEASLTLATETSGSAQLEFGTVPGGVRKGRPDLEGRCWQGLPVWVLAVTGYDNGNALPGRLATYPEAREASPLRTFAACDEIR